VQRVLYEFREVLFEGGWRCWPGARRLVAWPSPQLSRKLAAQGVYVGEGREGGGRVVVVVKELERGQGPDASLRIFDCHSGNPFLFTFAKLQHIRTSTNGQIV